MNQPHTEIFRTGRPHEILMVLNELKAAGIPVFPYEEGGGLKTVMPQTPVAGPDTYWVINVPQVAAEDARAIINSLPVDAGNNPGPWHFQPGKVVEKRWRLFNLVWIAALLFMLLHSVLQELGLL